MRECCAGIRGTYIKVMPKPSTRRQSLKWMRISVFPECWWHEMFRRNASYSTDPLRNRGIGKNTVWHSSNQEHTHFLSRLFYLSFSLHTSNNLKSLTDRNKSPITSSGQRTTPVLKLRATTPLQKVRQCIRQCFFLCRYLSPQKREARHSDMRHVWLRTWMEFQAHSLHMHTCSCFLFYLVVLVVLSFFDFVSLSLFLLILQLT